MKDKIFAVKGNKIQSMLLADESLQFSSKSFYTVDEFEEAWAKKLSLATKVEIKYASIKSITKEETADEILIKYKSMINFPSDCEFTFTDLSDYDLFFTFFEKEHYFTKFFQKLTPFKAVQNYLIGLAFTIAVTLFCYYQALEILSGTVEEPSSGKAQLFNNIIGWLGDKGVLIIGGVVCILICYKIWLRFTNPPNQTNFVKPIQ